MPAIKIPHFTEPVNRAAAHLRVWISLDDEHKLLFGVLLVAEFAVTFAQPILRHHRLRIVWKELQELLIFGNGVLVILVLVKIVGMVDLDFGNYGWPDGRRALRRRRGRLLGQKDACQ